MSRMRERPTTSWSMDAILDELRPLTEEERDHCFKLHCAERPHLVEEALMLLAMDGDLALDELGEDARELPASLTDNGRYRYERRLGGGGTATVWQAFDTKLKRHVAVKIFDQANRSVDQVLAEAKAAGDIRA